MMADVNHQPQRIRLQVVGHVQGMGFRPFVWQLAKRLGLTGSIHNTPSGVVIEIQGTRRALSTFKQDLQEKKPTLARIEKVTDLAVPVQSAEKFEIELSSPQQTRLTPYVLPDLAFCEECQREFQDPNDRRFRYPFINCTSCGPRYTIVSETPYDRERTTMRSFSMCPSCDHEYRDPKSRRFHAQPIACPDCGPQIWFVEQCEGNRLAFPSCRDVVGEAAVNAFRKVVASGGIVAVKGVGGFHLICDAYHSHAVAELRRRKARDEKPFAIMVAYADVAGRFSDITPSERRVLEGHVAPIVLLTKRTDRRLHDHDAAMLERVAPGSHRIGVLLPYSPLHSLLMEDFSALVITSANLSEEPIVSTNEAAFDHLASIADGYILHDREIEIACDDSVLSVVDDKPLPIRLARGIAPVCLPLRKNGPCVLAVGGDLKASLCLVQGQRAHVTPYIGDLASWGAIERLDNQISHFERLLRIKPDAVAADLHPGYQSRRFALEFAQSRGIPVIGIQHHSAHVASLLAEHFSDVDSEIIACCFDGTGYSPGGSILGGEFFVTGTKGFEHFAQMSPVSLPGGDACIRQPYRTALSYLYHYGEAWSEALPCVSVCRKEELRLLNQQLTQNIHCVPSGSVGRLFDAVASLLGLCQNAGYEAHGAMMLESVATQCDTRVDPKHQAFTIQEGAIRQVGCAPLMRMLCDHKMREMGVSYLASLFHHAMAEMIANVCRLARDHSGIPKVGLTGGVFQNSLLLRLTQQRLQGLGFDVLTHEIVPPNDGGIALGQAMLAREEILSS